MENMEFKKLTPEEMEKIAGGAEFEYVPVIVCRNCGTNHTYEEKPTVCKSCGSDDLFPAVLVKVIY